MTGGALLGSIVGLGFMSMFGNNDGIDIVDGGGV